MISLARDQVALVERLVTSTLSLLETEYPNTIRLELRREPSVDAGRFTPKAIYPAFYGCYDWHSAVHSHWQVVSGLRTLAGASFESCYSSDRCHGM